MLYTYDVKVSISFARFSSRTCRNNTQYSDDEKKLDFMFFSHAFKYFTLRLVVQFYPQYHEIYLRASKKLQTMCQNKDFIMFEQDIKDKSPVNSPIRTPSMLTLFSLPLARLHDYLDVVRQLLGAVSGADPDLPNLKEAEAKLVQIDGEILNMDARLQRLERLEHLQSKFEKKQLDGGTVDIIEENRTLVYHGQLRKLSTKGVKHSYHFHLFNDLLLYSKVNASGKFLLHRQMPLATCRVDALASDVEAIRSHKFKLSSTTGKSFQVLAPSAHERMTWITKLQESIDTCEKGKFAINTCEKGKGLTTVTAEWKQKRCPLCDKSFGMLVSRHHCRQCGNIVCAACSPHRVILTDIHATQQSRVCNRCITGDSRNSFKLSVRVQKAQFLAPMEVLPGVTYRSPYCVVALQQIHFAKKKLPVIKHSNNPVWGDKGNAVLFVDNTSTAVLHLEIWDERGRRPPVFLGQCEVRLTNIPVDLTTVSASSQLSHDFKMELKPRTAKDDFCEGNLFFSVELNIPMAMLDKQTDYFSLLRQHTLALATPPTSIALASVIVLYHDTKRRLETAGADQQVQEHDGTPLVAIRDYMTTADNELRLHEGEVVFGLTQQTAEVWLGQDMDGKQGTFPASCVQPSTERVMLKTFLNNTLLQLEAFRKQILDAQCSPLPSIVNEVLGSADFSTLSERKKVIYEMLKSEVVYVRDLRRFDRLYAEPLKQAANGGMLKVLVGWRN